MEDKRLYWFNYMTGEYDYREMPSTDDEVLNYIPQDVAVWGLYRCHRQMDKGIAEAMIATLTACVEATS